MRKKIALVLAGVCVCGCFCGCESLARKFVRKPKEPPKPRGGILLEPQEYGSQRPSRELYDQYFLFWKSWQDEFITALSGSSHKRQADTVAQALKNLAEMRQCLDDQSKATLDGYIRMLERLQDATAADVYCAHVLAHGTEAEKIRRLIINDFSPGRVKEHLL